MPQVGGVWQLGVLLELGMLQAENGPSVKSRIPPRKWSCRGEDLSRALAGGRRASRKPGREREVQQDVGTRAPAVQRTRVGWKGSTRTDGTWAGDKPCVLTLQLPEEEKVATLTLVRRQRYPIKRKISWYDSGRWNLAKYTVFRKKPPLPLLCCEGNKQPHASWIPAARRKCNGRQVPSRVLVTSRKISGEFVKTPRY